MDKKKHVGRAILRVCFFIVLALLIILFAALCYVRQTWPDVTYAELQYHLQTSFGGTNLDMVFEPLLKYGVPALIGIIVAIIGIVFLKKKNTVLYRTVSILALVVLILMNAVSAYAFNKRTNVISDFYNTTFKDNNSDFIEQVYVSPADVDIQFPEQKRNLIYIYLESMETTFSDEANGGFFQDNYIPNLTNLAHEYDDFAGDSDQLDGGYSLPGTNWTAAAMFAHTSGLPLDLPVHEGAITNPDQFFPTITTLGDILKDQGYVNIIEMGSTAGFGGKSAYYTKHGDFEIHDYDYAIAQGYIDSDYSVFWGYEDEKLIEFAKKEITELAKGEQPFNYNMITVDTHCQDGYVCRLCDDKYGDNQYANVVDCSDRQVSDFIKWIQEQDFYDNTTIVVTGDHTTMDAGFIDAIDENYPRKTYTCYINSAVEPQLDTYREYATIDLFPTTLAALGVQMSSDRLGCGTNLYGTQQTIIEEYGKDYVWNEFSMNSDFVEGLVKFKVDDDVMANAQDLAYLEVAEENGNIRFRLMQVDTMSCKNVRELKMTVHNNATGEDTEYTMDAEVARSGWHGMLHSDIPFTEVGNIDCKVYISVDDFDNYLFKEFPADQLEMWDVRWDFE